MTIKGNKNKQYGYEKFDWIRGLTNGCIDWSTTSLGWKITDGRPVILYSHIGVTWMEILVTAF